MSGGTRTNCAQGHPFAGENLGVLPGGRRFCRICDRVRKKRYGDKAKTRRTETTCPTCMKVRLVGFQHSNRLKRFPRECSSCARKAARKEMRFQPSVCAHCGANYVPLSGHAKYCDGCSVGRKSKHRRVEDITRPCPVCGTMFRGYRNKKACGQSCLRRLRLNGTYFGGRMFQAEGWDAKTCLLCERAVAKRFHVHHVFGHPDHSVLVVLCPGCHDVVSTLAQRKTFGDRQFARLRWYALAQRLGHPPNGEDRP